MLVDKNLKGGGCRRSKLDKRYHNLAHNLEQLRRDFGWQLGNLYFAIAKRDGRNIPEKDLLAYETGNAFPPEDHVVALAAAYGVATDVLWASDYRDVTKAVNIAQSEEALQRSSRISDQIRQNIREVVRTRTSSAIPADRWIEIIMQYSGSGGTHGASQPDFWDSDTAAHPTLARRPSGRCPLCSGTDAHCHLARSHWTYDR